MFLYTMNDTAPFLLFRKQLIVVDFMWQMYGGMTDGELQLVRESMLAFFQDMNVRVRILYFAYSF